MLVFCGAGTRSGMAREALAPDVLGAHQQGRASTKPGAC